MKHETSDGTPELSAALLERAKTGDREALAGLYTATELEIYRTVHAILKDEELCRDVQQETYLRAFSRLEELRDPAAFLPWLRQIAVNEARMQLRRKRPLLFSELSVEPDAGEPELPDLRAEASPELSLERKENARLVREILDGLPEGQRLLLGMFYYEQIPIKEIAAETGLSEGTVKAQLFRGRKRVETEVKRLEEKGVKLYGLSPLPFLLALLRRQEPAAEAGKTLMAETFTRAGIAPAAEAVGLHVGRSFFQTGLGKLVLGVIAAGVVAGGVAGWHWYQDNFGYGDVRPTEIFEIELRHDTEENLTTEPTVDTEVPTTESDTAEDLVPETGEPLKSNESEKNTEPAQQPTDSSPNPVNPEPTRPSNPTAAQPESGSNPKEEQLNRLPAYLGEITLEYSNEWSWTYSFETNRQFYISQFQHDNRAESGMLVDVSYENGIQTIKVMPHEAGTHIISISADQRTWQKLVTIHINNWWEAEPEPTPESTAEPETENHSAPKFLRCGLGSQPINAEEVNDLSPGETFFYVVVEGNTAPELFTDDPLMITLGACEQPFQGVYTQNEYESVYYWPLTINGCGIAHLYVDLCGVRIKTITINNT